MENIEAIIIGVAINVISAFVVFVSKRFFLYIKRKTTRTKPHKQSGGKPND